MQDPENHAADPIIGKVGLSGAASSLSPHFWPSYGFGSFRGFTESISQLWLAL